MWKTGLFHTMDLHVQFRTLTPILSINTHSNEAMNGKVRVMSSQAAQNEKKKIQQQSSSSNLHAYHIFPLRNVDSKLFSVFTLRFFYFPFVCVDGVIDSCLSAITIEKNAQFLSFILSLSISC